jgi:hypothetical protein
MVYFMVIWSILRLIGIFYGHLVYFVVLWYIFQHFGMLYKKNLATLLPGQKQRHKDKSKPSN